MQLGLVLGSGSAAADMALARRAEQAGFHSVHTFDFFASNSLVRLGGIAAVTSELEIGSAIANTFTRSPMVLASAALDLDAMSNGRLVLGLGTGLERMNVEWYGVPFGKPVTRVKELIALLREVFRTSGPGFRWSGDSWNLNIPAYAREAGPREVIPVRLAAVNRGMISAAGLVDEIAIACTPDEFRDRLQLWQDITPEPLVFPATIGVPPERLQANLDAILSNQVGQW